jgi:hypothetical protein
MTNYEERRKLEQRIDAVENRIEKRHLGGNLRLIAPKRKIEGLEEQLKKRQEI